VKALPNQEASAQRALESLNDIIVPEPVSLLPQTAGWIVLGVVILAVLAAWAVFARRRYRRNAYRREALELLDATPPHALPALVKRVALAAEPRTAVAALTGDSWLVFLDRSYGGDGFSNGPGRALATLSFAPAAPDARVPDELHDLVALWIRKHRV
jgi:hypothetical protein